MWYTFWNPDTESFTCQTPCHESRGNYFSCYSQGVALHAIADSVSVYKDLTLPIVEPAVKATLKFRNPKYGAYSVSSHGKENSGDDDINYDDNAHLLRAFIELYEATGNKKYLQMSKEIQRFMLGGIKEHETWKVKGCMWHVSRKYMATISNSVGATGAMKMIKYAESKEEEQQLYQFAKTCLNFIFELMLDKSDDVIMDGVGIDSTTIDKSKYSYNQGSTLSALCLMYTYDKNPYWKEMADRVVDGCINPHKTLFDRDYKDMNKRFLHGVSYFNQLLIEGVVDYALTFQKEAKPEVLEQCKFQIARHLSYFRKYCYDPKDKLYFMNFDIYKIDHDTYKMYKEIFGGDKPYNPDPRERAKNMDDTPVDQRPAVKTLIGAAAAAHIFFQGGRLLPNMDPVEV